jgi:hypothetical protein
MPKDDKSVEEYVLQNLHGIIPMEQWHFHSANKTDPFESYTLDEKRKITRKFRKLKRKAKVGRETYAASMWRAVNRLLYKDVNNE